MVPDGHAALQGLSSIPHLTSVVAAFYRSDIISGSETSADRARALMHKFAVAPARLIDNGGRRAIGIALRPQHFIGDVLGMNRCHGRRHRATRGGHGGARLSLSSLFCRCAGRADGVLSVGHSQEIIGMKTSPTQGRWDNLILLPESAARPHSGLNCRFSFGRRLHANIFL